MVVSASSRWFGSRLWLGLAVVAVIGVGSYYGWRHWRASKPDLSQYQLVKVQRTDLEDLVTATGNLQPREYVDVGAQVSGQLKKIHVEVGSLVQEGDLLAEIDPTVYRANVDARRAQLKNLQASLLDRQSQLQLAEEQQTRQRGLIGGDATTLEALQQAEASVRSARAQISALQAQIEQMESTLRADEANLSYANIYSPMSGVVVSITARQGQTINATQQAPIILRVADLSTMTVQTQVSEADISQLRPDMDAYFTTLGNRGRRWWGKLRKVEPTPTVTNNVVLYNALFDVTNDRRDLLPQMTAQVFFVAARAEDALVVPASAVTIERGRPGGGRSDGAAGASAPAGAPASTPASTPGSAASGARAPRAAAPVGQPTIRRVVATADDIAQMSREERRAMFERMSPEEREAMRERMRARREAGEGAGGPARAERGERPERAASDGTREQPQQARAPRPAQAQARPQAQSQVQPKEQSQAQAPATPYPVWAGVSPGRTQTERKGVVKVVTRDGRIEERQVKVGISNRVQVQILEGLKEGEEVVAGVKQPAGPAGSGGGRDGNRSALTGGGGPGGPGGFGGPGGGRGR